MDLRFFCTAFLLAFGVGIRFPLFYFPFHLLATAFLQARQKVSGKWKSPLIA
jgi:hypothetical protein